MSTYSNKTSKILKKPLVEFKHIEVKFDHLTALSDINLTIFEHDFMYIVGPNGAGKSTLIKLLTHMLNPTNGQISVYTQSLGYLPQLNHQRTNFPITVNEVIYTGFKKQKLFMSKSDKKIIDHWLKKMDIADIGNQLMSTLSGGQQQRVLLIRSLVSNPEVLILDEPTSALDPSFKASFNHLLYDLNKQGMTIILVTHDIKEIKHDATIVYLNQTVEFSGNYDQYQSFGGTHNHV